MSTGSDWKVKTKRYVALGVRKYKLNIMGEKLMRILRNAGCQQCDKMKQ